MNKNLILAVPVLIAVVSCHETKSPFDRDVANYSVVDIEAPDLRGITDNGKEVLNLYRFAADEVDAIYWEQYFGDKQTLLDGIKDPVQKTFAEINYGPWDRTSGKSFVEGYSDRLPGAGFYPADMTKEEFNAWDNPDKKIWFKVMKELEEQCDDDADFDNVVVWDVITNELTSLREQINRYLTETDWEQWEQPSNI